MKQFDLKKLSLPLVICFVFTAIIINSCRKDNKPQPLADPVLNQAKTWYESAYPATGNTRMLITQNTRPAVVNNNFDFSQYIKPDWSHAKKYSRLGKNVIELPIDPSGKIYSAIKNQTNGKILNPKENSRNSFILLNDGKNYEAYVMTLLPDSAYAKSHPNWTSGNTYQKRDPDFSGLVLYFTPKGQYVSGYAFKNGQQVIPAIQNTTRSTNAKGELTRSFRPRTQVETIYDCTAWYLLEYDQWGNLTSMTFLYYTDCTPELDSSDPGGGGGSPSTAAPPPPQCQPPSGSAIVNNHSLTRVTQPPPGGGDGGMPPPQPCPVEVPVPQTDTTKDPCAQAKTLAGDIKFKTEMTDLQSKTGLPNEVGYTIDGSGNYTYVQGAAGAASINLAPATPLSGYIHSHYTGTFPTFSGSDVRAIYQLQQAGKISNISTFTAGVVTASGTTYIMKISDPTKFATFSATNLNTDASFKSFEDFYQNNQIKFSLLGNDSTTSYEIALLTALADSGITILKGDGTFSSWSTETIDANNKTVITKCN